MIEWEDSYRPMPAWVHLSDFEAKAPSRCISVGWMIHNGDEAKALAPNLGGLNDDNAQACGIICIPARCVVPRSIGMRLRSLIEPGNQTQPQRLAA